MISNALGAVFGFKITVLYRNGARMRMRARQFDITVTGDGLTKAAWRRPLLSWSREPLWLNVDEVVAVWQGRA